MKLYIPTCTLNFNNIFATSSFSPQKYYSERNFGNKRFYPVEPNNQENAITLFSKFPYFDIDSDLENYPMVIEVETEDYASDMFQLIDQHEDVEIYLCNRTIYLNPFHCFVYFRDYRAKQATISKAAQSLENKFVNLYANNLKIKHPERQKTIVGKITSWINSEEQKDNSFIWDPSYSVTSPADWHVDSHSDLLTDRIRGFVYCYIIGKCVAASPEIGRLNALVRRMHNTLSAIVNSYDKKPSSAQRESIIKDIHEFNEIYSQIDDVSKHNNEVILANLKGQDKGLTNEQIIHVLRVNGVYEDFKKRLNLKRVYNASELLACIDSPSQDYYDRVINNLYSAVKHVESNAIRKNEKPLFSELFDFEENQIKISGDKGFFGKLVNSQINGEYRSLMKEKGIEDNESLGLALNGGTILKAIMGEEWKGSDASLYIAALLEHFQSDSAFDLFSIDSSILQSFAAFCQKGDNIDRLIEYLRQQGFYDYSFAFGIYGATRGFASLPKTFTKFLIDGDRGYLSLIIQDFYNKYFSTEIKNPELPEGEASTATVPSRIGREIIENIDKIQPHPQKQEEVVKAVAKAAELEMAVLSPRAFMYILDSFSRMTSTKAYKSLEKAGFAEEPQYHDAESFRNRIYSIIGSKDLKSQKDKIDRAIMLESLRDNREAFLKILDNFLDRQDKAYKRIKKLLEKDFSIPSQSNESVLQPLQNNEVSRQSPIGKNEQPTIPGFGGEDMLSENTPRTVIPTYGTHFYNDPGAWNNIETLIPLQFRDKIKSDFDWFIGEMRKDPGSRFKYYRDFNVEDDEHIIFAFCRLKESLNSYGKPMAPYFSKDLREAIKSRLLSIYCTNNKK